MADADKKEQVTPTENEQVDVALEENDSYIIPEGMKRVSGKRQKSLVKKEKKVNSVEHSIKIALNQVVRDAGRAGIPIFTVYYTEADGYVFNGILPEEIGTDAVQSEYGKFDEFLRTCIGFNKEEALKSVKIWN